MSYSEYCTMGNIGFAKQCIRTNLDFLDNFFPFVVLIFISSLLIAL